ncbi:hypothetical protein YE105_C3811 [Yersinia enterocolitica subsp. palearctica 105.5R(r)]|uniref:Uncharacterized protein n=1 Tax=Yersinia enterocolitica subsp. palearctica serotype O:3 (strain DSM 13030 / CIP 106945 / Y11) TaxID=930944 RepID=A0A0H3NZL2_YERE1|nr:hypothetical protein YE105_C3811 [Yersinia enterocolitica subsp. palearctica 105.5R(r)]CBY29428.1 hypothetical protein Y11_31021 [Yersinia enterocolitica subsp. palearctica Y11]CCO68072.1 hypothetical protein D322_1192 [Yersinia enterocolitica IP 10393]
MCFITLTLFYLKPLIDIGFIDDVTKIIMNAHDNYSMQ